MKFWKYVELFEEYKYFHNISVKKMTYNMEDEPEETTWKTVVYF